MVCAAPDYPAFISGWEFPGQKGVPDARRRFEVLWSVDPPAIRDAALICAQIARPLSPVSAALADDLPDGAPPRLGRPAPRHRRVQPDGELPGQAERPLTGPRT